MSTRRISYAFFVVAAALSFTVLPLLCQTAAPSGTTSAITRSVGTVKAISGNTITLTTDSGSSLTAVIQDSTRIVRIAPGEKDLKNAAAAQLQEVQVGDRVLVRGVASNDNSSVTASLLVLMKETDVAAKQEQERSDWQKRGVGGLVSAVDASGGVITISSSSLSGKKTITVHVSPATIVRRYAPDSVKFEDAKPGTLAQIRPGDQLRARGNRNPESTDLVAEEIVSGAFQNIAGVVVSSDSTNNTLTVTDLETKRPVTLRITADSQLRKLPEMAAQRIAMRLRGEAPAAPGGGGSPVARPATVARGDQAEARSGGGGRAGGLPDFQQMLNRMPPVSLTDLKKGDAIMVVTTEGTANRQPTAITLLSGVEAILSASPSAGHAAMLLSPWNLGGGAGDAAGANQ